MAAGPSSAGEPSKPPPRESTPAPGAAEDVKPTPPPSPPSSDSPAPPPPSPPSSRAPPSPAPPPPASENKPRQTSTAPPPAKTWAPAADIKPSSLSSSSTASSSIANSTSGSYTNSTTPSGIAGLTNALGAADGGAAASRPGLGSGAVAGITLGAVLLGFALGALVAMFFFRRKHRRAESETAPAASSSSWRRSGVVEHIGNKDGAGMSAAPAAKSAPARQPSSASSASSSILSPLAVVVRAASAQAAHPASATASDPLRLDQFLLSPAPDQAIASELQALDHLIQMHVENYYHLGRMQPSTAVRDELQCALVDLGLGKEPSEPTPAQVVTLAVKPKTRHAALRHIIASAMSQSVALGSTTNYSLLPSSLRLFVKEMAPTEKDRGSPKAVSTALTRWRQMSMFLIHPNRSDRSTLVPTEAMVGDKVNKLAVALNKLLDIFVNPQGSGQQQIHLHDLLMEWAKFGYLLLSQPGEFCLRQVAEGQPGQGKGHLVVCPGLVKVGNEQGEAYNPSRTLLAPATERI
ncbi:hypothetical protein GGTG_08425 [Gaeumannomyces tritici R3-111a-1]|uniref:Uncharacterized protein n=1 Tax=Gaeumannomyces tritici (strain R3-111a-1) TaxID=644352 RepID=J3P4I8_GAET3|nr:hypothetical protein GGTG_08425 [Gaeumannomyces tritici R3-111a-1]EJT74585.1 hypothetical protein GGTG_08425 [Gaeumannomyces tritici R3-111a-1]